MPCLQGTGSMGSTASIINLTLACVVSPLQGEVKSKVKKP